MTVAAPRTATPGPRAVGASAACTGEALRILDLMDSEDLTEAAVAIEALPRLCPGDAAAAVLQEVLRCRLDLRQGAPCASGVAPRQPGGVAPTRKEATEPEASPAAPPIAPVAVPPRATPRTATPQTAEAEALKRRGMTLYGQGKLEGALDCWRRALSLDPTDEEAQRFVRRAEAVLSSQRGQ